MRFNTSVLAVFVLISSALAAPVITRPVTRRSVARRSAQAILSKASPASCAAGDANGPSWREELCAKMPHVTGFVEAGTASCRKPQSIGGGTGTCYIKSDRPISRVYRRMIPVPEESQNAPGPLSTPDPSTAFSNPPTDPPVVNPASTGVPDNSTATTTSTDGSTSATSALVTPTTTSSSGVAASTTSDPLPPAAATAVTNPEDSTSKPGPDQLPSPSNSTATSVSGTATATGISQPEVSPPTLEKTMPAGQTTPTAKGPVEQSGPGSQPPAQAPLSTPKSKLTTPAAKEGIEDPSSTSSTDAISAPTSPAVPSANVPILHGTEGTWGGTLVNTINGMKSPKAGARVQAQHGTQKLSRVVGSFIFDLVYGRFLF